MDKNQPAKDFETLGDAARRLLAGLERAEKKVAGNQSPDQIQDSAMPLAEKEPVKVAAEISAIFTGNARLGGLRRVGENDNFAAEVLSRPLTGCMPLGRDQRGFGCDRLTTGVSAARWEMD